VTRLRCCTPVQTRTKFLLDESRMPRHWYNIMADLPTPPAPPLHPGTLQPVGPTTWRRCSRWS
jgi:predicted alternative tryptophan synthase beta-subunit